MGIYMGYVESGKLREEKKIAYSSKKYRRQNEREIGQLARNIAKYLQFISDFLLIFSKSH